MRYLLERVEVEEATLDAELTKLREEYAMGRLEATKANSEFKLI